MGEDAYERPATDDEIALMQAVVADAMAGGAAGFASSASPTHNGDSGRPVPSRVADLAELRALLEPLKQCGRGVVALLPGGVFPNEEVFRLQREVGRPFTWTALLTVKGYPYHEKVIAEHDAAWADGVEVWPQVSCRPLVFQMNLSEPFTLNMRPTFAALMGKSKQERVAAYRDPSWRAKAWDDVSGKAGGFPLNWAAISVAESRSAPRAGRPSGGGAGRGARLHAARRHARRLAGRRPPGAVLVGAGQRRPRRHRLAAPRDNVLLGLADSGAHVSQLCDACFSTDLLGNWVHERGVMPLERAIHKLTGEPAAVYGLADRGTVEVGKAADLCVFDPETVAPGPLRRLRDFPADGERLTADAPVGMTHTLVNGVPIRVDGAPAEQGLDARPGVVLRG